MSIDSIDYEAVGREMHSLAAELFPICRSITGPGVRETLRRLQAEMPLQIFEVASGTAAHDWEVPKEWQIRDAYIKDGEGNRVVDFQASNLHIVSGSCAINETMAWSKLKPHLHTLPDHPDWIPYRTSFHGEGWGFSLRHSVYESLEALGDAAYEVCIDADVINGSLTYGEVYIPGESTDEVLLTTHVCHPSLANDNLSGIAVATKLAAWLSTAPRRYSYRLIFIPATIGAITWLSVNEDRVDRIKHGLVLALLGDSGTPHYRKSRRQNAEIDRVATHVLSCTGEESGILDFEPFGYDQRQFCSPGYDLPIGCLMRSVNNTFPEYHTSADNLDFIQAPYLADSLKKCIGIIKVLEGNRVYVNQKPKCEPRLGKHGLYKSFGCDDNQARLQEAVLWVLNLSDGNHSLLDIADRAGRPFDEVRRAADLLEACDLLAEQSNPVNSSESDTPAATDCPPNSLATT